MQAAFIYQILTPLTSREALDPGFLVLDNTANERPDWFEYWPIRNFLLREALDEASYYGFLSPRFKQKTNLDAADAYAAVRAARGDLVLFSPSIQNSSYYLNVFAHGEAEHRGLMEVAKQFFARIGRVTDLDELVSDSRNTVTSNYFAARPPFWRAWFALTEALFAIAESPDDPLGQLLRAPTTYRGRADVQMKIFIMERIASWLLVSDPRFAAVVCDPFAARSRLYKLPLAIVCDSLKIAYATQGRRQYKEMFVMLSGLRGWLNWQVRIGSLCGSKHVRPTLDSLASYWDRTRS